MVLPGPSLMWGRPWRSAWLSPHLPQMLASCSKESIGPPARDLPVAQKSLVFRAEWDQVPSLTLIVGDANLLLNQNFVPATNPF